MNDSYRLKQLAHVDECLALCDRMPSAQEVADPQFVLSQPLAGLPQADLPL